MQTWAAETPASSSFCFASLPWWSVWVAPPFTAPWETRTLRFAGTFPEMRTSTWGRSSVGYLTSSTGSLLARSSLYSVCALEELASGLLQGSCRAPAATATSWKHVIPGKRPTATARGGFSPCEANGYYAAKLVIWYHQMSFIAGLIYIILEPNPRMIWGEERLGSVTFYMENGAVDPGYTRGNTVPHLLVANCQVWFKLVGHPLTVSQGAQHIMTQTFAESSL